MKQNEPLTWDTADIPTSKRFEDRYFSAHDGYEETKAVFLKGNDLPARWQAGGSFQIAELGFGTGLNFLTSCKLFAQYKKRGSTLTFTSFELYPLSKHQMHRALGNWPDLKELADGLLQKWPPKPGAPIQLGNVVLDLIEGDARTTLPQWSSRADVWFLDGFSPAKNPQLWEADLMQAVYDHTAPGGTFSTYTAAGFVRRNLQTAGFDVARVEGFGGKRERLQGIRA